MIKIDFNAQNEKVIFITGKIESFRLKVKDITHISCEAYECTIHLINGATCSVVHLLKEFEEKLKGLDFFRANRRTLINTEYFIGSRITHKARTVNINGITIEISRRKVALLKKTIYGVPSDCKRGQ